MCGIIGYTGRRRALPILLAGLADLEYRGYDSAGIAIFEKSELTQIKSCGRLAELCRKLGDESAFTSTCGIGHTRWATHGAPSDCNAHPHRVGKVCAVHNGIIENYGALRDAAEQRGVVFHSQTDTEAAVAALSDAYERTGEPISALAATLGILCGSYALGIVFADRPGEIYAVRRESPLLVARDEEGAYLASDVTALLPYTKEVFRLEEGEIAVLREDGIQIFNHQGAFLPKSSETITWGRDAAQKGGFAHFMRKEISEEAHSIEQTVHAENNRMSSIGALPWRDVKRIHIAACGTAMHAGLFGKRWIEDWAGVETSVSIASEFRYHPPLLARDDLFLAISQSGETADTLAALRLAGERGIHTAAIVNVVGSTVAREADAVFYTAAGPEIAVASTKAYAVQLASLCLLAAHLAESRGNMTAQAVESLRRTLLTEVPAAIDRVIENEEKLRMMAEKIHHAEHLFYIGRGQDYLLAEEASLKLKEVSYIHSEAYPAGELKHGTISLITDGTPVIAIATDPSLYSKILSSIREVRARGAEVYLLCREDFPITDAEASLSLPLPALELPFMPFPTATAFQLLSYHAAVCRGCDVDKPRNLAKSVTVE